MILPKSVAAWQCVLEDSKVKFCIWMATEFAFPSDHSPNHLRVVADYICNALFDHEEESGYVEDGKHRSFYCHDCTLITYCVGYYPNYEKCMICYVYQYAIQIKHQANILIAAVE
jgi:hypothetical protein